MTDKCNFNSPEHLLSELENHLKSLRDAIATEEQMAQGLKDRGLIRAGTWMKDGKYLYLVYPSDGCSGRKREYVGADQATIEKAIEGIQRATEYDTKLRNIEALRQLLHNVERHLGDAIRAAELHRYV